MSTMLNKVYDLVFTRQMKKMQIHLDKQLEKNTRNLKKDILKIKESSDIENKRFNETLSQRN